GNKENKWGMNPLPDGLRPGFRRRQDTPSPEKFNGLSFSVAGRSIGPRDDNDEALPSFGCGAQSDRQRRAARAVRRRRRRGPIVEWYSWRDSNTPASWSTARRSDH